MTNTQAIATGKTTVKDHKGGRVWIEGGKPYQAGFVPGAKYSVEYGLNYIALQLDSQGSRAVAGKDKRSIIDLCNVDVGAVLELGNKIAVSYYNGLIIFSKLED